MKTNLQKITYWVSVSVIGVIFGFSLQFARAWIEPSVTAPSGNVGAPINTGSVAQTKTGTLNVEALGVGTVTPGVKIEVRQNAADMGAVYIESSGANTDPANKNPYGLEVVSNAGNGIIAVGKATGILGFATGDASGVYGQTDSQDNTKAGVRGAGVYKGVYGAAGDMYMGAGVFGDAYGYSTGVQGNSQYMGTGVLGLNSYMGAGVAGESYQGKGVFGYGGEADFYAAHGTYASASSIRWKSNIQPIDNALEKVLNMRGVYYDWDQEHGGKKHDLGFIAEEVGKQFPEVITWDKNSPGYAEGMDYGHMTPVLVEAIKDQQKQIEELKNEINNLKNAQNK